MMFEVLRHCEPAPAGAAIHLSRQPEKDGLLRYARNDGVRALVVHTVMSAKVGIHAFLSFCGTTGVDGRVKRDHDGVRASMANAVIASEAKQSSLFLATVRKTGLLRRRAPRNDGVRALVAHTVMPAKAGIHALLSFCGTTGVDGRVKRDHDGVRATIANAVIASEAKQSSLFLATVGKTGLLRRCAPRNDALRALVVHTVMPAKPGIHALLSFCGATGVDGRVKRDHDGVRVVCGYA